ncbi:hypothetical protein EMIT0347P_50521 [Pseudomonas sp. IT-347P]
MYNRQISVGCQSTIASKLTPTVGLSAFN